MKIVCISDTHLQHDFKIPEGDVLVHAGDFTFRGSPHELEQAAIWLSSQPHKHIIFIAGNHDWGFQNNREQAELIFARSKRMHYLQDSEIVIDGVKFYGSPWQPWFHDWAFNVDRGPKIAACWEMIPEDTDVLITHGPPAGILDRTPYGNESVGCLDLWHRLQYVEPKLHVFGHIHHSYGQTRVKRSDFVNACICNEKYRPVNQPIVVDL